MNTVRRGGICDGPMDDPVFLRDDSERRIYVATNPVTPVILEAPRGHPMGKRGGGVKGA